MWILYFLFYPVDAFQASSDGVLLWFYQILPTLLPYSILSTVILRSNLIPEMMQKNLPQKILHISPAEWFVIGCGFLFGFPIGCKLSADMLREGLIDQKRAQILCAFTNNMSPLFVSSFVLNGQLHHMELQKATFGILYGIPAVFGILWLYCFDKHSMNNCEDTPNTSRHSNRTVVENSMENLHNKKPASRFEVSMQIIDAGIISSFETLIRLCGYIVMFSIMAHIFTQFPFHNPFLTVFATGFLEITTGTIAVASAPISFAIKYVLEIMFLALGGISGIAQTGSMIMDTGLSVIKYVKIKLVITFLVTVSAILYQFLLLRLIL